MLMIVNNQVVVNGNQEVCSDHPDCNCSNCQWWRKFDANQALDKTVADWSEQLDALMCNEDHKWPDSWMKQSAFIGYPFYELVEWYQVPMRQSVQVLDFEDEIAF